MGVSAVILLLVLGIALLMLEFLVLPGTNVSGIIGLLLILASIYFGYKELGTVAGNVILVIALLAFVSSMVFMLRAKTWQRLSLKSAINSTVENVEIEKVKEGDLGITLSRLNPIGTVSVNGMIFEGKSGHNSYIDPETQIEVVRIEGNQLIVKPI